MPTYEYACKSCGEHLEVVQSFKDDPLTECPGCGGPLRKVFGAIGISFKGSGFYRTDNRASARAERKAESTSDSAKGDKGDSGKGDSAKGDSAKGDSGKGDSGKSESGKSDAGAAKSDGAGSSNQAKPKSSEKTA